LPERYEFEYLWRQTIMRPCREAQITSLVACCFIDTVILQQWAVLLCEKPMLFFYIRCWRQQRSFKWARGWYYTITQQGSISGMFIRHLHYTDYLLISKQSMKVLSANKL